MLQEIIRNSTLEEILEEVAVVETKQQNSILILHNDDQNTFDFVIDSLMAVCAHSIEQAEQCTWMVHYKGKCDVKRGDISSLKKMHKELVDRGLSSEIVD